MDWELEALMAMQAVVAAVLGALVGLERELDGREAGVRTYGSISLGAFVFAPISTHLSTGNNTHVIAARVVSGVDFLGAGVILQGSGQRYRADHGGDAVGDGPTLG